MNKLGSEADKLIKNMNDFEDNLFNMWHNGILTAIQNQAHIYAMNGQLMELDHEAGGESGALLKVNYDDKLVTLVKDTRAMCEHGFAKKINPNITKIAEQAKKFYKEGVGLK
jgi:hypothetical protein